MKTNYTYQDYMNALDGVGPKLKEIVLERATKDDNIDFEQLIALADYAYPT